MYENLLELCKQVKEERNCKHIKIIGSKIALYKSGLSYNKLELEDCIIEVVPCMFLEDDNTIYVIPGEDDKPVKIKFIED